MSASALLVLIVRILSVALFLPFSALDKILNFAKARAQTSSVFHSLSFATFVTLSGLTIEVICSLAVVTGFADRLGAAVLALYCGATAILFKKFWKPGDFLTRSDGQGRILFWDFLKNFALGAALLLITIGPDGSHWRDMLFDPLASTHPYARSHL
jgi:putative oxidoreductase